MFPGSDVPFFYFNSGHWHILFANLFIEHDSRLGLALGFWLRVRLELRLRLVLGLWLSCGLGRVTVT